MNKKDQSEVDFQDGLLRDMVEKQARRIGELKENSVDLLDYTDFTGTTATYKDAGTGSSDALSYVSLGLASEAGEVAGKVSKLLYRDGDTPQLRKEISKELGDVIWFWIRACKELKLNPVQVIEENKIKLRGRKDRGVLNGSGDNR